MTTLISKLSALKEILKKLLFITGQVLFVLGIVLNILMIFFGFWPSLIYLMAIVLGLILISLNKSSNTTFVLKSINYRSVKKATKFLMIAIFSTFLIIVVIILLSRNYIKKSNTLNECRDIQEVLERYKADTGLYPESLSVIIKNFPLRMNWDKDDWGNELKYKTGVNRTQFILTSPGQDSRFGSKDDIVLTNH